MPGTPPQREDARGIVLEDSSFAGLSRSGSGSALAAFAYVQPQVMESGDNNGNDGYNNVLEVCLHRTGARCPSACRLTLVSAPIRVCPGRGARALDERPAVYTARTGRAEPCVPDAGALRVRLAVPGAHLGSWDASPRTYLPIRGTWLIGAQFSPHACAPATRRPCSAPLAPACCSRPSSPARLQLTWSSNSR